MEHIGVKKIETNRLILDKITLKDVDDMYEYAANEKVTKFLSWEIHKNKLETETLIKKFIEGYKGLDFYLWKISTKENNKMIGTIDARYNEKDNFFEIGYALSFEYWNKGYMTEALGGIIEFIFLNFNVEEVRAKYVAENIGSGKVMQKNNMKKIYEIEEYEYKKGYIKKANVFSITRKEYNDLKKI